MVTGVSWAVALSFPPLRAFWVYMGAAMLALTLAARKMKMKKL